ncbi:hypothetical protein O6H91_17G028500 [Diphasiastrum complanatum]|uniref:Uncharacterized protein n=1 Tax=Diphasiastrum complanatum TaxID=34168 RepID=A0ACC2B587_DIPCM|nr:hypothetical protein O6H91_17G028500 [Diphasiastrum complanatum]
MRMAASDCPVLPIRLINLPQTLDKQGGICFTKPTGWEFHIISHTWSQDLQTWSSKISNLLRCRAACLPLWSSKIGDLLRSRRVCSQTQSDSYNELFESQDFSKDKGYDFFVGFLRILRADGVENVWFDALCINQADVKERSREIKHMGSYYSRSLACYVWTHGVGQGFNLWSEKEGRACLPRWFSRVWTFQELLLPKNIIFVARLKKEERQLLINSGTCFKAYSLMNHEMTYCCSKDASHLVMGQRSEDQSACFRDNHPSSLAQDIGPLASFQVDELGSLVKGVFICDKCGSEVGDSRQFAGSVMCLVERAAYLDLMDRAGHELIARKDEQTLLRLHRKDEENLLRLYSLVREAHGDLDDLAILRVHGLLEQRAGAEETVALKVFEPQVVLGEIGERECSHDEDRVLSILGLLGVEEIAPVRAGKSLRYQILALATSLVETGRTELLLKLCSAPFLSDYEAAAGMSWVPPFKVPSSLRNEYRDSFLEVCTNLSFQPLAHVQSLTPSGLTLSCHLFKAKVSLLSPSTQATSSPLPTLGLSLPHDPHTTYPLLSHSSSHQLSLTSPPDSTADLMGSLLLQAKAMDSISKSPTFSFHVWLLLLTSSGDDGNVFMACVGKHINRLHKVGIIIIPQDPHYNTVSEEERKTCTIGGFGKYLPTNLLTSQIYSRVHFCLLCLYNRSHSRWEEINMWLSNKLMAWRSTFQNENS